MRDAKLPIAYRDSCASLLIPLNRCRVETYYMPWKCEVRANDLPCPVLSRPSTASNRFACTSAATNPDRSPRIRPSLDNGGAD